MRKPVTWISGRRAFPVERRAYAKAWGQEPAGVIGGARRPGWPEQRSTRDGVGKGSERAHGLRALLMIWLSLNEMETPGWFCAEQ